MSIDADFQRIVHPDFVFDDFGVEAGVAEFLGDVVGGGFVFDGARHVRSLGQDAEMFFGELGIGDGEESGFGRGLGGGVAEAEDGRGGGRWLDLLVSVDGRASKMRCRKECGERGLHGALGFERK